MFITGIYIFMCLFICQNLPVIHFPMSGFLVPYILFLSSFYLVEQQLELLYTYLPGNNCTLIATLKGIECR
jgi:hypothetical protein